LRLRSKGSPKVRERGRNKGRNKGRNEVEDRVPLGAGTPARREEVDTRRFLPRRTLERALPNSEHQAPTVKGESTLELTPVSIEEGVGLIPSPLRKRKKQGGYTQRLRGERSAKLRCR
jgi:hypothetical protein